MPGQKSQRYRDEVNRLKGEQGQPKIKGNKPKPPTSNHSSEKERHKRKRHAKSSKKAEIHIDREEVVDVDRGESLRMRSTRAVKMWWCRICSYTRTTCVLQAEVLFGFDEEDLSGGVAERV